MSLAAVDYHDSTYLKFMFIIADVLQHMHHVVVIPYARATGCSDVVVELGADESEPMVTIPEIAPTPRFASECQLTVPREVEGLEERLEKILTIYWDSVQSEILVPLLEAEYLANVLQEKLDAYRRWQHFACNAIVSVIGMDAALSLAEQAETILFALIAQNGERTLGEAAKAFDSSLQIRTILRQSLLRMLADADPVLVASTDFSKVESAITAHELCIAATTHYLEAEKKQQQANAKVLATWAFQYADQAYGELGGIQIHLGEYSAVTSG